MYRNLKTRREHLKVLPLQKRLQAMENIRKESFFSSFQEILNKKTSYKDLLANVITFLITKEGFTYWYKINYKYFSNEKITDVPTEIITELNELPNAFRR